MLRLESIDFCGYLDDGFLPFLEAWGQGGFNVCLLLEDEGGKERYDLFGLEVGENVFEDQFRKYEFVCRMDLRLGSGMNRHVFPES